MNKLAFGTIITLFLLAMVYLDRLIITRYSQPVTADPNQLPVYSAERLTEFDGTDPDKPVLLAYDGYVYDVSPGRESFYNPGKPYHDLVGKDSSALLHLAGGSIIANKYSIVGIYQ